MNNKHIEIGFSDNLAPPGYVCACVNMQAIILTLIQKTGQNQRLLLLLFYDITWY